MAKTFTSIPFWRLCLILAVLSCTISNKNLDARVVEADEAALRAAVLVGILRYTRWQLKAPQDGVDVCLSRSNALYPVLQKQNGRKLVRDLRLRVRSVDESATPDESCHVLVVDNKQLAEDLMAQHSENSMVVCSGCRKSYREKSCIVLVKNQSRIGFIVNLRQAKKNKVSFSSSLLELALKIEEHDG